LNSGYDSTLTLEKEAENSQNSKTEVIHTIFVTQNGIYFKNREGETVFIDRSSIRKIKYDYSHRKSKNESTSK
jgi:hypothetical protein